MRSFFIFFIVLTTVSTLSHATTYTWAKNTDGAGTYSWIPTEVPTTGDDVVFNSSTAPQTITFQMGMLTLNSLIGVEAANKLYTLDRTGCSLLISERGMHFMYVAIPNANSISITASDNVLMGTSTFGSFATAVIANSTTKARTATPNSPATNTYTNQVLQVQSCVFTGDW